MDSLTQIILGAAVGEICLGKKLGNKAMVWGAIAGTIPDLDVMSHYFLEQVDALAFHRGISHSIFFAVTFPFLLAYIAKTFYDKRWHQFGKLRTTGSTISTLAILLLLVIFLLVGYVAGKIIGLALLGLPMLIFTIYIIRRIWVSRKINLDIDTNITYKEWYIFFFWTVFTHPILDCFTVYGTQLFQPFSDYRVAFNNIAVADPIYTVLFGLCLLVATTFRRNDPRRMKWNFLGIALSCLYMVWTFYNKNEVNHVMEKTLESMKIEYSRYMTSPTILNNILWTGTAEADTSFWTGQYSLFDKNNEFNLNEVPKNHHLIKPALTEDRTLKIIKWFSKDYCAVLAINDTIQISDLRYGQLDSNKGNIPSNYVFRFPLVETAYGYKLMGGEGGPPPAERDSMFQKLWNRILGQ